jgi:hypothetical protein
MDLGNIIVKKIYGDTKEIFNKINYTEKVKYIMLLEY